MRQLTRTLCLCGAPQGGSHHEVRLCNLGAHVLGPVQIQLASSQKEHAVPNVENVWVCVELLGKVTSEQLPPDEIQSTGDFAVVVVSAQALEFLAQRLLLFLVGGCLDRCVQLVSDLPVYGPELIDENALHEECALLICYIAPPVPVVPAFTIKTQPAKWQQQKININSMHKSNASFCKRKSSCHV
jgi:hypothetical protein